MFTYYNKNKNNEQNINQYILNKEEKITIYLNYDSINNLKKIYKFY